MNISYLPGLDTEPRPDWSYRRSSTRGSLVFPEFQINGGTSPIYWLDVRDLDGTVVLTIWWPASFGRPDALPDGTTLHTDPCSNRSRVDHKITSTHASDHAAQRAAEAFLAAEHARYARLALDGVDEERKALIALIHKSQADA